MTERRETLDHLRDSLKASGLKSAFVDEVMLYRRYLCGGKPGGSFSAYLDEHFRRPTTERQDKLPDNLITCSECGSKFDPRSLDEVMAHQHKGPHLVTGIVGREIKPPRD